MHVQVRVALTAAATAVHQEAMRLAAFSRTNDRGSVQIFVPEDSAERVVAVLTVEKARQREIVDYIGKAFRVVEDYADCTIEFPKKSPTWCKE